MNGLFDLLHGQLGQRLTWTLLHFVWQGLAVVLLLTVLFWILRVRKAHARYAISVFALLAMVACLPATFILVKLPVPTPSPLIAETVPSRQLSSPVNAGCQAELQPADSDQRYARPLGMGSMSQPAHSAAWPASFDYAQILSVSQPYLLMLWSLGVILLSVRLLLGLACLSRVREGKTRVTEKVARRVVHLAKLLGFAKIPPAFSSLRVAEAVALGFMRPMILIPAAWLVEMTPEVLEAVIAHELAHIRRWDLWVNLFQHFVETLLFYHPAVWWLSRCIRREREMCCDELAVSATGRRVTYVDALQEVVRRRVRAIQPAAATVIAIGGNKMAILERVRYLLGVTPAQDNIRWWPVGILTMLVPLLFWFSPVLGAKPDAAEDAVKVTSKATSSIKAADAKSTAEDLKLEKSTPHDSSNEVAQPTGKTQRDGPADWRLSGVVRGPDGTTVARADVYLEVGLPQRPSDKLRPPALPLEENAQRQFEPKPEYHIIGQARTDTAGHFVLEPKSLPVGDEVCRIVAVAKHFGLVIQLWDRKASELEIRLPSMVLIEGRLLTPDRTPAADVVVKAIYLSRGKDYYPIVDQFLAEKDYPPYWPRPARSNAQGEFTLDGVPAGCHLLLDLTHPSFAREDVTVDTDQGPTEGTRGFEIPLLPPTFTHILEPPRPVEGIVTTADTGKPLAGVLVEVTPMDRHGGMPILTHTDATGHFRVSDKAGEHYFITVFPLPDSGYLAESVCGERWPQGAKSFVQDFKLARGALVQGRVLNNASGKPIAGASVEYHPSPKNPNSKTANRDRDYEFRNPVLTDGEGRFELTGLEGAGYLTVETPERIYIRKPLSEGQDYHSRVMPMGYTVIDGAPQAASNEEVVIRLQRGRTVTLQAVGPDGERLPSVIAAWEGRDALHEEIWDHGESFSEGKITIRDIDPERTTRVFMIDLQRKIGAAYDITSETPQGPVEVRLQPNATITGQAVSADDEPADAQAYLKMCFDPQIKQLSTKEPDIFRYQFYDNFTDQQGHNEHIPGGRFSFDNVLPGIPLSVTATENGQRSRTISVDPLRPGERRDLGRVILQAK